MREDYGGRYVSMHVCSQACMRVVLCFYGCLYAMSVLRQWIVYGGQ
jgi:hypothetical protein